MKVSVKKRTHISTTVIVQALRDAGYPIPHYAKMTSINPTGSAAFEWVSVEEMPSKKR